MNRFSTLGLLVLTVVGGCPLYDPAARYQATIDAQIGISTTSGEAPMHVVVSAAQSSSAKGTIVKYIWDFAGQARSEEMAAEHTFYSPGRYPITLTVVDAAGEQASTSIYVRVSGGSVTAVINADRLSGPAPLGIQFDGGASTAVDDTNLEYFWNFGDGTESRQSAPVHVYNHAGTYTVTLQVVSAGGISGIAEATVTVGEGTSAGSLQFNGTQYANLAVAAAEPLAAFTFEAWCSPDTTGGTLVNFGVPNVGIDVSPTDGAITVRAGGESFPTAAALQPARWQHVAVSYASDGGATVYLDGTAVGTLSLEGEFSVSLLSLGAGSDQTLANNADGGEDGTLGASDAQEPADPAWSTDSP